MNGREGSAALGALSRKRRASRRGGRGGGSSGGGGGGTGRGCRGRGRGASGLQRDGRRSHSGWETPPRDSPGQAKFEAGFSSRRAPARHGGPDRGRATRPGRRGRGAEAAGAP